MNVFLVHMSASGGKSQRLGSSMIPSMTPSIPAHWSGISSWLSVVHVNGGMKLEELTEPVIGEEARSP